MSFSDIIKEKVSSGEWLGIGFYVESNVWDDIGMKVDDRVLKDTNWFIKIFNNEKDTKVKMKIPWSQDDHTIPNVVNLLSSRIYQWFKGFAKVNAEAEDNTNMPFIPEGLWYFDLDKISIIKDLLIFVINDGIELSEKESYFDSISYRSSIDQIRRSTILVS